MKRFIPILFIVLMVFMVMVAGCATTDGVDTPEKKYLVARAELNLLLEQYIDIQDKISDSDHKTIKLAFISAGDALDIWEEHVSDDDYDFTTDYKAWLDAKSLVLKILKEVYGE